VGMTPTEFIGLMTDRIVKRFQPVQIILFGSQARGDAGRDSDIDLLVVLPRVTDKRQSAIEIRRALGDLPVCKDIIVTTPDELARSRQRTGSILRTALLEGRVIYGAG
jgi:predicted nucleotidyltransferase